MKAIVMGAGIIGVTTAYFLARQGYQVIVIDKNAASGLGCSYANGGQLSYSHIDPLASKNSLKLLAKALLLPDSFLSVKNFADPDFLKFSYQLLKNCAKEKSLSNSQKLFILGRYSTMAMQEIMREENIKFDYQNQGILHFFRNQKLFNKAIQRAKIEQSFGSKLSILNKEQCLKKEPTLVKLYDEQKLAGGILHNDDASGNSFLFLKSLEKICSEKYNVVFEYNAEIRNIFTNYQKITGIHTSAGVFTGDKYIFALGAYGNKFLNGIGIKTNIYPLKGYSLSIEANEEHIAPNCALTDIENRIVYSRIGNIFRAAGTIEIQGLKASKNQPQINFLRNKVKESFSDFGNMNQASEWVGVRPVRPNSIPLICEVKKFGNLYINAGHGHLGWTLSAGSAKIISELCEGHVRDNLRFLDKELQM